MLLLGLKAAQARNSPSAATTRLVVALAPHLEARSTSTGHRAVDGRARVGGVVRPWPGAGSPAACRPAWSAMLAWPSSSCTARRSPLDCSRWRRSCGAACAGARGWAGRRRCAARAQPRAAALVAQAPPALARRTAPARPAAPCRRAAPARPRRACQRGAPRGTRGACCPCPARARSACRRPDSRRSRPGRRSSPVSSPRAGRCRRAARRWRGRARPAAGQLLGQRPARPGPPRGPPPAPWAGAGRLGRRARRPPGCARPRPARPSQRYSRARR
jgi:hypothetical protein